LRKISHPQIITSNMLFNTLFALVAASIVAAAPQGTAPTASAPKAVAPGISPSLLPTTLQGDTDSRQQLKVLPLPFPRDSAEAGLGASTVNHSGVHLGLPHQNLPEHVFEDHAFSLRSNMSVLETKPTLFGLEISIHWQAQGKFVHKLSQIITFQLILYISMDICVYSVLCYLFTKTYITLLCRDNVSYLPKGLWISHYV
jgi:hypothetical protein